MGAYGRAEIRFRSLTGMMIAVSDRSSMILNVIMIKILRH